MCFEAKSTQSRVMWHQSKEHLHATVLNENNLIVGDISLPIIQNQTILPDQHNLTISPIQFHTDPAFIKWSVIRRIFGLEKNEMQKIKKNGQAGLELLLKAHSEPDQNLFKNFSNYEIQQFFQNKKSDFFRLGLSDRIQCVKIYQTLFPFWLYLRPVECFSIILKLSSQKRKFLEEILPDCKHEVPIINKRLIDFLYLFPENRWQTFLKTFIPSICEILGDKNSMVLFLSKSAQCEVDFQTLVNIQLQDLQDILKILNRLRPLVGVQGIAPLVTFLTNIHANQYKELIDRTSDILKIFPFKKKLFLLIKAIHRIDRSAWSNIDECMLILKKYLHSVDVFTKAVIALSKINCSDRISVAKTCLIIFQNRTTHDINNIDIFIDFISGIKEGDRQQWAERISLYCTKSKISLRKMVKFLIERPANKHAFDRVYNFIFPRFEERVFGEIFFNHVKAATPEFWEDVVPKINTLLLKTRKELSIDCVFGNVIALGDRWALFIDVLLPFAPLITKTSLANLCLFFKDIDPMELTFQDMISIIANIHFVDNLHFISFYKSMTQLVDVQDLKEDDLEIIQAIGELPQIELAWTIEKIKEVQKKLEQNGVIYNKRDVLNNLRVFEETDLVEDAFFVKNVVDHLSLKVFFQIMEVISLIEGDRKAKLGKIVESYKHDFKQLMKKISDFAFVQTLPISLKKKKEIFNSSDTKLLGFIEVTKNPHLLSKYKTNLHTQLTNCIAKLQAFRTFSTEIFCNELVGFILAHEKILKLNNPEPLWIVTAKFREFYDRPGQTPRIYTSKISAQSLKLPYGKGIPALRQHPLDLEAVFKVSLPKDITQTSIVLNVDKFRHARLKFQVSLELHNQGKSFLNNMLVELKSNYAIPFSFEYEDGFLQRVWSKHGMVKFLYGQEPKQSQTSYLLLKIFKYLSSFSDELLSNGLSEKQEAFLKLSHAGHACKSGFMEGVSSFYHSLPSQFKIEDQSSVNKATVGQLIENNFQSMLNDVLISDSFLEKIGVPAATAEEVLFIKSLLFRHIGFRFEIPRDISFSLVREELISVSLETLLELFYQELKISNFIRKIDCDPMFASHQVLSVVFNLVPQEEDYYVLNEKGSLKLTKNGIVQLLKSMDWLK